MVLQLSQSLGALRQGSVLKLVSSEGWSRIKEALKGGRPSRFSGQHWRRTGCEVLGGWQHGLGSDAWCHAGLCMLCFHITVSLCSVSHKIMYHCLRWQMWLACRYHDRHALAKASVVN